MSSIGPQMPPHLTKRKRTPDEHGADSPPTKHTRNNTDEIDLDDEDSDDAYGPTAPSAPAAHKNPTPSSKPSIGPTLPPPNPTNSSEIPLDDSDSEDGYGPTAPRVSASNQEASKTKPSIGPTLPPKQAIGPAMPPPDHRPSAPDSASDSDSDDDDYGPALPSSTTSVQRAQAAAAEAAAAIASQGPAAPQRDDWMLAPPTQSGYQERDPTKLKNRKFASGKSSAAAGGGGGGISSIWTETPEQKRKRLEDAVLGRGDPTQAGNEKNQQPHRTKEEVERERRISENIASARGKSMYEEHRQNKKHSGKPAEEEEDDPSKRAFDREKDMSLGGKIGTAQRRELLNKAKDFGGRFQKGSYL